MYDTRVLTVSHSKVCQTLQVTIVCGYYLFVCNFRQMCNLSVVLWTVKVSPDCSPQQQFAVLGQYSCLYKLQKLQ